MYALDNLPVAPGMSNKLTINTNDKKTTSNVCDVNNTSLEDEWAEDVGGFWDDGVPEITTQPDTAPELIVLDEINHIKVIIINKYL